MIALSDDVWKNWLPRPRVRTWPWICQNVSNWTGKPFDPENIPWGEGLCDAFDDPQYREYVLQWATRTAKTFLCLSLQLAVWANRPMPTMFGSATESVATSIVREKIYKMLERCPPLRSQLRPPSRRSMHHIDLAFNTCRVCWSGSDTSLADFSAWLAHANELDKWDRAISDEADPVELLLERVKEYADSKALLEGTPTEQGRSRIEARRLPGTNCSLWVPCQRCGAYQPLVFGEDEPGKKGIIYDQPADGTSDPDMAYATARYLCSSCHRENHDEDRARMMRACRWAPEGQYVDKKGNVRGHAKRPHTRVWSSQLSSLYSLQLRWGDVAAKWVRSFRRPKERQNFVNSWLGLTFTTALSSIKPEDLATKLAVPENHIRVVPDGMAFLVVGVDRQIDHRVYVVLACGPEERCAIVDYGVVQTDEELYRDVIQATYPNAAGDRQFTAAAVLYDSGYEPDDVYRFCRTYSTIERPILPCKGTDNPLAGHSYKKSRLGDSGRKVMRTAALSAIGQILVFVQNDYWQRVLDRYFNECRPGEPASLSLPQEAIGDMELAEQLLNAKRESSVDKKGKRRLVWMKRDPDSPDDFRSALRYARVMAELYLRGRWSRVVAMVERAGRPPDPPRKPTKSEEREAQQEQRQTGYVRPLTGRRTLSRRGGGSRDDGDRTGDG